MKNMENMENVMNQYNQEIEDLRKDLREEGLPDNGSTFEIRAEEIYKFYFDSEDEESEEVIPCDFSRYEGSEISYEPFDTFEGNHVEATWDKEGEYVFLTIYPKDGGLEINITNISRNIAESIVHDIEENPDDYFIRVYNFQNGRGELAVLYHQLEEMPFDKNGIHATGVEYLETNGDWITEYEDEEDHDFIVKEVKF